MPVKSAKQFRFMEGVAHGDIAGPSVKVAKEFLDKTPHATKSEFASEKRKKRFSSALRKAK